jgi:peptide chain release factor 3
VVMSFEHQALAFNLLDTAGHRDFSPLGFERGALPHPDRGPPTLPSPASGGRLGRGQLDAAGRVAEEHRGADPRSSSRSGGCATCRSSPSSTKLDREGRDPFDLLDEIERSLALDVTAASGPIGMGRDFLGTRPRRPEIGCGSCQMGHSPNCARRSRWRRGRARRSTLAYRDGHLTPVYFGSALNNFAT